MTSRVIILAAALLFCASVNPVVAAPKKACKGPPAQRAMCADAELGALAREVDRLFTLTGKTPGVTKEGRATALERQKEWRVERDACEVARDCLLEQHLARILALRQTAPADVKGISRGPAVFQCDGVAETVSAIFTTTKTPRAYIAWGDYAYVLTGDGADGRFVVDLDTGPMSFTRSAGDATLATPGRPASVCRPAN